MSINNRQLWLALGCTAGVAGVLGTAGLSFDGGFDPRRLVFTLPFAVGAAAAALQAPRSSAAMLYGAASGAFAIEAWTADINRQSCTTLLEFVSSLGSVAALNACSPIGLAALVIAAVASVTAAVLVVGTTRTIRVVVSVLAGIVLAPVVLYLLSIATFVLGGA